MPIVTAAEVYLVDLEVGPPQWDLRCLRANAPLWRVAGGFRSRIPVYDTETGWLHLEVDELVRGAKAAADAGWRGTKVKIGKPSPATDVDRLSAIRDVVGPTSTSMELHVSLVAAVPNGRNVEHIPQLRSITTAELAVVDGHAVAPETPGLGIAWDRDAMDDRRVA